jgi:hypothetical protein
MKHQKMPLPAPAQLEQPWLMEKSWSEVVERVEKSVRAIKRSRQLLIATQNLVADHRREGQELRQLAE